MRPLPRRNQTLYVGRLFRKDIKVSHHASSTWARLHALCHLTGCHAQTSHSRMTVVQRAAFVYSPFHFTAHITGSSEFRGSRNHASFFSFLSLPQSSENARQQVHTTRTYRVNSASHNSYHLFQTTSIPGHALILCTIYCHAIFQRQRAWPRWIILSEIQGQGSRKIYRGYQKTYAGGVRKRDRRVHRYVVGCRLGK